MRVLLSRRQLFATSAAAALVPSLRSHAAGPPSLAVERRTIEVNGKPASVFGIRQPNGTHGLVLDPGQRFNVSVANRCGEATIVHWHGQTPAPEQDGVAETGGRIIQPGTVETYDFAARPGTHWMHSHHGLQEQALLAAPLIVRTAADVRADAQEVTLLLHDFTFRDPAELLASITRGDSPGHDMAGMPGMTMPGVAAPVQPVAGQDLNDVEYDAYLANDRTLDDPEVVRTAPGGRVMLRLINGATTSAFWIDIGVLEGTVAAADGNPVRPIGGRRFPLAQGQRLDILLTVPRAGGAFPILAQREGDRERTGIILASAGAAIRKVSGLADAAALAIDNSLERRLVADVPLAPASAPSVMHRVALTGSMMPYVWSLDDRVWADHQPLRAAKGQRVVIEMVNRTRMAHPMHLHGHHFQVIGLNGVPVMGAVRDTVLVPVDGSVTVAFDADNPGRWLFHCHNLFHMAAGMMTELAYDGIA